MRALSARSHKSIGLYVFAPRSRRVSGGDFLKRSEVKTKKPSGSEGFCRGLATRKQETKLSTFNNNLETCELCQPHEDCIQKRFRRSKGVAYAPQGNPRKFQDSMQLVVS